MCGITGKIFFNSGQVEGKDISRMNRAIKHRGPDDNGVYISKNCKIGLGHQRLSIIDLSSFGHQPMSYKNRYRIVFNGEIYNFKSLKKQLIKEGHRFISNSDTEVILALYDKHKEDCLTHLRGMFAFAIYDSRQETLFCARDRVGKKPFKYYADNNVFLFASELKSIITQPEYKKELDAIAIHHYLTFQYVPSPFTGFKNIQKLGPGHYLNINLKTGKIQKKKYWNLDFSKKITLSETEWRKCILEKLEDSIKLRMISDVPIGAFLSGGIDSSAVVAIMSKHSARPVKTFSIGFKEEKYNELPFARMIAKKFKTDHTEMIIKPNVLEDLPKIVRYYEEPFADTSSLPSYYVSKLTREHVTVALSGDGGDENFAGYDRYTIQKASLLFDKFTILHSLAKSSIKSLAASIDNPTLHRLKRFSEHLNEPYPKRYADLISYFPNSAKESMYTESFKNKIKRVDSHDLITNRFYESNNINKLDQTLYADITTYLPDDLLVKMDIASMASSLEVRSPFLDHELLELTAQIPTNLKLKGFNNKKYILKKALGGLIPHEILYRKKRGFSIPVDEWLRNDLKSFSYDLLTQNSCLIKQGILKEESIHKLLDRHTNTKSNHGRQIWALIMLEMWLKEYMN